MIGQTVKLTHLAAKKKRTKCPQFINGNVDEVGILVWRGAVNVLFLHRRRQFFSGGKKRPVFKNRKAGWLLVLKFKESIYFSCYLNEVKRFG